MRLQAGRAVHAAATGARRAGRACWKSLSTEQARLGIESRVHDAGVHEHPEMVLHLMAKERGCEQSSLRLRRLQHAHSLPVSRPPVCAQSAHSHPLRKNRNQRSCPQPHPAPALRAWNGLRLPPVADLLFLLIFSSSLLQRGGGAAKAIGKE